MPEASAWGGGSARRTGGGQAGMVRGQHGFFGGGLDNVGVEGVFVRRTRRQWTLTCLNFRRIRRSLLVAAPHYG